MDAAAPRALGIPGIKELKLSAEHTQLELQTPSDLPRIGDRVEFVVAIPIRRSTCTKKLSLFARGKWKACGRWQRAER
jgi:hypothetical protein